MVHAVLDLFAGTGVGVACRNMGVTEYAVEKMPAAQETRKLNGMGLAYDDVWDIDKAAGLDFDTIWASPPCQTFSVAGKGGGRKALDEVLEAIRTWRWTSMDSLRRLGDEVGDERTALVLTPLAYIYRYRPTYVAFEQVPAVLPVWEACAGVMRNMGYSVWTGYIHAEQYGVPQTRKRAYLIARSDGKEAKPPTPTHSRYYARNPEKLDPGVKKWVSMAEGLASSSLDPVWDNRPATTVVGSSLIAGPGTSVFVKGGVPRQGRPGAHQATNVERATLQGYPEGFEWSSRAVGQIGNAVPPPVAAKTLGVFDE